MASNHMDGSNATPGSPRGTFHELKSLDSENNDQENLDDSRDAKTAALGAGDSSQQALEQKNSNNAAQLLVLLGLASAVLCLGLDRSILATAIPKITSEFNSLDDIAWYGSSYLLTTCCFQLMFGKLYAEFRASWVFLAALGIFEVGSIVCAAAPNSMALIIGRAVAGIGCAGVLTGALNIIAQAVPLHRRPVFTGLIGGVSGIAQVAAPTLGGVFTDRLTWRWCFWINLPLGGIAAVAVFFFVRLPIPKSHNVGGLRNLVKRLDIPGTVVFMPCVVCLLLALQWGGTAYDWDNWRIILLLCLFPVLLVIWGYMQYRLGENGTLPLRIVRQRSVASGMWFVVGASGAFFTITYYVPIWFQSVKDASAEQSGINFLAASGPMSVAALLSGFLTTAVGYYVPQMYLGAVVSSIASGLIYRYNIDTTTAYWAGTLVMFGIGCGMALQLPLIAVQTVLQGSDISIGTSVIILAQTISGTIFLAVGQNLFQTKLVEELLARVPEIDPAVVTGNGVTGLTTLVAEKYGEATVRLVLEAYNTALRQCFLVCIVMSCITLLGAIPMEWKSVRSGKNKDQGLESDPQP